MKRIWINGKEYAGPDEMPPEVRRDYEWSLGLGKDEDGDGLPDIVEMGGPEGDGGMGDGEPPDEFSSEVRQVHSTIDITINGKKYSSWDEVPEESRRKLQRAMGGVRPPVELLAGMQNPSEIFQRLSHGSKAVEDMGPTLDRTSGISVKRESPREVRVEVSGSWGWVVALVLALMVMALLVFGR